MENKKIYIDFTGRCGNQMFQYAFARKLSLLNGINLLSFNFYHVERKRKEYGNDSSFRDEISSFNIMNSETIRSCPFSVHDYGSKFQNKLFANYSFKRKWSFRLRIPSLLRIYQRNMQKHGIYYEDETQIELVPSNENNIFIKGYFENPAYFNDIRDILIKEFTPKLPPKEKNKHLYDIINNTNSVCVSIRVWDEIANDSKLFSQRNVCTPDFYKKAIETMASKVQNPTFIVFSNNVDWVKNNIVFPRDVYYENGDDEIWEKMRLMYSCKHFVLSTSTFCWWAQFLSRNKNKIVVSPDKWFADGTHSFLLSHEWIKIGDC